VKPQKGPATRDRLQTYPVSTGRAAPAQADSPAADRAASQTDAERATRSARMLHGAWEEALERASDLRFLLWAILGLNQ